MNDDEEKDSSGESDEGAPIWLKLLAFGVLGLGAYAGIQYAIDNFRDRRIKASNPNFWRSGW